MNGIINTLKPPGMTSHDMVSILRKKMGTKKVGHTGTLDPNAAGVLPICIGEATKISQFLLESNKKYRTELTLGIVTDTQDMYGSVLSEKLVTSTKNEIIDAIHSFKGEYNQLPPMYSALKVKGKKLYELAREGKEIERNSRRVFIEDINIIKIDGNKILMDVICSKGTYIRTLCHDIGEKLGCGGTMSFLLRTATGAFVLEEALTIEEIKDKKKEDIHVYPIDYPLNHIPKAMVEPQMERMAVNGNKINGCYVRTEKEVKNNQMLRIYVAGGFIGLATVIKSNQAQWHIKFNRLFNIT